MRTMLVWRRATTLPIVIVSAASTHMNGSTTSDRPGKASRISSSRATNPAAFDDTDRKAVIGVGAPS